MPCPINCAWWAESNDTTLDFIAPPEDPHPTLPVFDRQYRVYDFVIDDEKYFLFQNYNQTGNDSFYSDNQNLTPSEVKYKFSKKNENKLMLYISISNRGISKP